MHTIQCKVLQDNYGNAIQGQARQEKARQGNVVIKIQCNAASMQLKCSCTSTAMQ